MSHKKNFSSHYKSIKERERRKLRDDDKEKAIKRGKKYKIKNGRHLKNFQYLIIDFAIKAAFSVYLFYFFCVLG